MRKIKITEVNEIITTDGNTIYCPMTFNSGATIECISMECISSCAWFRIDNHYTDSNTKAAYCGDKLIGEVEAEK